MKAVFVAFNSKYVHTNIAVRYLTRYCGSYGFDCAFAEYSINDIYHNLISNLYMLPADVYGFSCYIWNIELALKLARDLKTLKPNCTIVLGGPEVSFDAEDLLAANGFIDCIVCGEGELSTLSLLRDLPDYKKIYRPDTAIDLNDLPFPYTTEDLGEIIKGEKLVYYETSRGCPFSCSFCLSGAAAGMSMLPLERVEREIAVMTGAGADTIKFVDRTFNANKERALQIWRYCAELVGDTKYHFEVGADLFDPETLDFLATVPDGRFQFEIGVQTANHAAIKAVSRTTDLEKLKHNVQTLRAHNNIHLHLDLIAGLPHEDYSSFKRSFNYVYDVRPHAFQLGFLKFLKGSAIRENACRFDAKYSAAPPYEIFANHAMSYEDIINLHVIEDVLERYYNSARFECSLPLIVQAFDSPFDFYESFSKMWRDKGLSGQGVKRIKLYDYIYSFASQRLTEAEMKNFSAALKLDFTKWHNNGRGVPEWYKAARVEPATPKT